MDQQGKPARCPKCGEPARRVLIEHTAVICQIQDDGSPGKVLSLRGHAKAAGYECGGGHAWRVE